MIDRLKLKARRLWRRSRRDLSDAWATLRQNGPGEVQFWIIALIVGIAAGTAALAFREAIIWLQATIYGESDFRLASFASELPWFRVLIIPIIGGLVVGLILWKFTPDGRIRSLAHVIEGAAMRNGRVEKRAGLASALASLITLSTGGSTGREGPVVHIGAVISSWVSNKIRADGVTARDLMGCAAAAAVSASFNAPIAGAIFAMEVVLRHFAMHAFAPIVIASVSGTVISRLYSGNVPEFTLPSHTLAFYVELPAFLILGIICGLVAVVMMRTIFVAERLGDRMQAATRMPTWARPAVAGAMLGLIAIFFPHIIGVGYETTNMALSGDLLFWNAVVFAIVKVIAVAITMAGRMGGGIFSPSLMMGALTGIAFGWVATAIFPTVSGAHTLYALAGMGALAAAVLGAPISTILIVFEMTGDWQAGIAVMASVSLATAFSSRLVDRSFFLTQLEQRDIHLAAGPQEYLLATIHVGAVMRPRGVENGASDTQSWELVDQGVTLAPGDTLETAMPLFQKLGMDFIPVTRPGAEGEAPDLIGALFLVDALRSYNRALAECAAEEHS
ncbi:chloride channel protein [Oceanomicrobium pacificus]|uniref:Chloride channel protein n=1 Tax=Oceanomicrobium pacificus TaxID=2692916 RepID=A0A6B0TLM3_9RHOB|nr:chloride channel protein [Oceanomicrobium pacificus]MXU65440.1 chloride channel protein [Oceanomicrobium pacificus]